MKMHIAVDILFDLPVPWRMNLNDNDHIPSSWCIDSKYAEELMKYGLVQPFKCQFLSTYKRSDKGHEFLKVYHEPVFNDFMELEEAMNVLDNLDEYMENYNAESPECD